MAIYKAYNNQNFSFLALKLTEILGKNLFFGTTIYSTRADIKFTPPGLVMNKVIEINLF